MLISACGNKTVPLNTDKAETTTAAPIPPSPSASVTCWMTESYVKTLGNASIPNDPSTEFDVKMAKNEVESCHIILHSDTDLSNVSIKKTSGEAAGVTVEFLEERLINVVSRLYPDPIVYIGDEGLEIKKGENKGILIRFRASAEAIAGEHEFTFDISDENGYVLCSVKVNLTVWNITLPEDQVCVTSCDVFEDQLKLYERIPTAFRDKFKECYTKYYEMLMDYRMSPCDIPVDILSDEADAYLSDPRLTSFMIETNIGDEKIKKIYEKLKTNPDWLDKAYIYIINEPTNVDMLNTLIERSDHYRALCPELKQMVNFYVNTQYDKDSDLIDVLAEKLDIICSKTCNWTPNYYHMIDPLNRGYVGDRLEQYKKEGKEIWWYLAWEPVEPYVNALINEAGINHREYFWQQYLYDVKGFQGWCANYWEQVDNPWENMGNYSLLGHTAYGDGSLLYPGHPVGMDGPSASLRLEIMRDGIEDFEILKLAEEKLGRDAVIELVKEVTPSLTEHTKDPEVFESVREKIAHALINAE